MEDRAIRGSVATPGEREAGFRAVNDAIRRIATSGPGDQTWDFFCECDDLACRDVVALTLREFDDRRERLPAEPILAGRHG